MSLWLEQAIGDYCLRMQFHVMGEVMSKNQKRKIPFLSKALLAISIFFTVLAVFFYAKAYFGG